MHELDLKTSHLLRICWLLAWRGVIGGLVFGFCIGFIVGMVAAAIGKLSVVQPYMQAIGVVVGIIWNINVVRMMFDKQYKGFRIALVSTD